MFMRLQLAAVTLTTLLAASPNSLNAAVLWLDGSDPFGNGSRPDHDAPVNYWVDKSGHGHTALPVIAPPFDTAPPTFQADVGMIYFNGINQALESSFDFGAEFEVGDDYTTFTVFRPRGQGGVVWANGPDNGPTHMLSVVGNEGKAQVRAYQGPTQQNISDHTVTDGLPHIAMFGVDSNAGFFSVDGRSQSNGLQIGLGNPSGQKLYLGMGVLANHSTYSTYRGDIGELIVFDRNLSEQQRADVNAYLGRKWGVSVPANGRALVGKGLVVGATVNEPGPGTQRDTRLPPHTGADNLVLVTHGWTNVEEANDYSLEIFDQIRGQAMLGLPTGTGGWEGVTYDWRDLATTGTFDFLDAINLGQPFEAGIAAAKEALGNASLLGFREGQEIARRGYMHIHLIAHSAGSAFIHNVTQVVSQESPDTVIHLTFLDSFVPNDGTAYYLTNYGKDADWAEQYFSVGVEPLTQELLLRAHNVNVTALGPGFANHGFPIEFYLDTAEATRQGLPALPESLDYGFGLSRESQVVSATWDPKSSHPHGSLCVLGGGGGCEQSKNAMVRLGDEIAFSDVLGMTSDTGDVHADGNAITLTTGSPVWFVTIVEFTEPVSFFSFDVDFKSGAGATGFLGVYVDDQLLLSFSEQLFGIGTANYEIGLPADLIGYHTIAFRLDTASELTSAVRISSFRPGFAVLVPEPSAWTLVIMLGGILSSSRCRRRIQMSKGRILRSDW